MPKFSSLFVASAMAVTAACAGVIAAFGLGLGVAGSSVAALAVMALLAVAHLTYVRSPGAERSGIEDLLYMHDELQARLDAVDARLTAIDAAAADRARTAQRPLVEEIATLGGLVTSIAKEVATHETALARLTAAPAPAPVPPATPLILTKPQVTPRPAAEPSAPAAPPVPAPRRAAETLASATPPIVAPRPAAPPGPAASPVPAPWSAASRPVPRPASPVEAFDPFEEPRIDDGLVGRIEDALREDRVEFHLQPIVSLPHRRTVSYEAFARIREVGGVLPPSEFLPTAGAAGLIPAIDRRGVARAAAVATRLQARGRPVGIFVNVAAATLADERAGAEMLALAKAAPIAAGLVALEMDQSSFAALGARERQTRDALVAAGFRFSLDETKDLRLDPRELARLGVRFVKARAATLLTAAPAPGSAIHPSDLANLLARHGVDLIATHVENERDVPELLDLDVKSAQGFLFGAPRPVREEPPQPEPAPAEEAQGSMASRRLAPRPLARRA